MCDYPWYLVQVNNCTSLTLSLTETANSDSVFVGMAGRKELINDFGRDASAAHLQEGAAASRRAAAWRRQALAAQQAARGLADAVRFAALRECYGELNDEEYLNQRAQAVAMLLEGCGEEADCDVQSAAEELHLEAGCAGTYESCQEDEIALEHLQTIRRALRHADAAPAARPPVGRFWEQRTTSNSHPGQRRTADGQSATDEAPTTTTRGNSPAASNLNAFRTAREELILQSHKKGGASACSGASTSAAAVAHATPLFNYGGTKKSLGARRNVRSNFVPPIPRPPAGEENGNAADVAGGLNPATTPAESAELTDPRLRNIDAKMVQLITNEIMHEYKDMDWNEIAGLEYAKSIIKEAVVYPLLRPDIFTGLRRPPRGILLFGPPGTGKTLIGKCIASKSKSTFFSISASSLTSKWIGDGEKMVRALFAVAAVRQPSVVFIDEIDSLLSQRSESEHESSRRLKTEFLIQLDGAATSDDDRILIIGATNRPQELDEAARRRFVKRLYIPLPEVQARAQILTNLLHKVANNLADSDVAAIGEQTDGYSGADMSSLCREASMEPIRSIPADEIPYVDVNNVRPVNLEDFKTALQNVRPSVSQMDLKQYTEWNRVYGSLQ